jgi:transcription elongation factor GreA
MATCARTPATTRQSTIWRCPTVVVEVEGDEERYTIVGAIEARPTNGLISNESPVGKALLGLRAGEEAVASGPHGGLRVRVLRIER